ncbi:MBL fold metallo-hydrolase [Candidatus Woesearchaeota archaeon]|nr:MAG: MBL fold metallo-hydrolase [Candidatus Woesearchaeota archaeon]
MKIKFWGVRGSIPTPGTDTVKYGGNTTCLEVLSSKGDEYILDAGTGIRVLGLDMLCRDKYKKKPIEAKILISHVHWDHIQGWPFFVPAYMPNNRFQIYGGARSKVKLEETLVGQKENQTLKATIENATMNKVTNHAFEMQQSRYVFPVRLEQMASNILFNDLKNGHFIQNNLDISFRQFTDMHPDGIVSYKLSENRTTFVYATDVEHNKQDEEFIEWIRDADVLYFDGQYLPEEYKNGKQGWGHSTYEKAVDFCLAANVKYVVLGHHEPTHNDIMLDKKLDLANRYLISKKGASKLHIALAREGQELYI